MLPPLSVLIVDDDRFCSAMLRAQWLLAMPDSAVVCREEADVTGDFDVYLLDNNFHGSELAVQLTRQARLQSPEALIIAFSSSLDRACLKGLLNAGCDAVAEKTDPADRVMVLELGRRFREARDADARPARDPSVLAGALQLLKQWNRRLELSKDLEVVHD